MNVFKEFRISPPKGPLHLLPILFPFIRVITRFHFKKFLQNIFWRILLVFMRTTYQKSRKVRPSEKLIFKIAPEKVVKLTTFMLFVEET